MITKSVTVSGAVGKQVYDPSLATSAGNQKVVLRGVILDTAAANGSVEIRQQNASGKTDLKISAISADSKVVDFAQKGIRYDEGMHVEVIGTGAVAYLLID